MTIVQKQWKVIIEDKTPYDGLGFLDTFAGEFILPIEQKLRRFWCSRYWDKTGKHILLRFETENYDAVKPSIEAIQKKFGANAFTEETYDHVSDLGHGENERFMGSDAREKDPKKRADLVYDFLTASARLYLGCLAKDTDGHWRLEKDTHSGMNRDTTMQAFHHLFCNMTNVPTYVFLFAAPGAVPGGITVLVESEMYAGKLVEEHPDWARQLARVRF
jgi:hypothetical protein